MLCIIMKLEKVKTTEELEQLDMYIFIQHLASCLYNNDVNLSN